MVQKLGKKEPQVKKTSCQQQILNRTGFLHLIYKIGTLRHQICTFFALLAWTVQKSPIYIFVNK